MAIEGYANSAQYLSANSSVNAGLDTQSVQQKVLGQEDFFKLLTTQLASQDPMNPMEDTAFIAQMASFSELEMTSQLTKSFEEFTSIQQFSVAQSYIGRVITSSDGAHGRVTAIEATGDNIEVFLDGSNSEGINVKKINKVEL